jgi:DNA-binding IclR family transcriptional regulator
MRKPKEAYSIQTVVNAMRLLEEFRDEEELGVTELARRLRLHKNNVFRLLATLEQQHYIEQSPSERYRLGVRSLELGQAFCRSRPLTRRARGFLEDLSARSRESSHLATMRDFDVVHLDGVSSEQLLQTGLRIGARLPVHCTALGKVLLGATREEVREAYDRNVIGAGCLDKRTDATIVDRDKFFEHLSAVAVRGFSVDQEECAPGLCCAAAPVFDADANVVAALSVSGPSVRLGEERLQGEIGPMVMDAAERLSRDLGYAS